METPHLVGILFVALLLVVPAGAAQSDPHGTAGDPRFAEDGADCRGHLPENATTACIVQYAHIFDLLNKVPLTVHRPPDEAGDISRGQSAVIGYEELWDLNHLTLVPNAAPVHYAADGSGVTPMYGIATDLTLDPEVPIHAYWYMSASGATLPCLTVHMSIETGRTPGAGERLTEGQATKTLTAGPAAAPSHTCPGEREATTTDERVAEFHIEMPPIQEPIPADAGFHVHVEWWNHAPDDPDARNKVYLTTWAVHSGPDHAPRVVLPVQDPLFAETGLVKFADGKAFLEGRFLSPFGSYDVDPESIGLVVRDHRGSPVEVTVQEPTLIYANQHAGELEPVRAAFVWDHALDGLTGGPYTATLSGSNWQWSGNATATFTLDVPEVSESPLAPVAFLLVALLTLAGRAVRRPH